jgi:hypothetical protein
MDRGLENILMAGLRGLFVVAVIYGVYFIYLRMRGPAKPVAPLTKDDLDKYQG